MQLSMLDFPTSSVPTSATLISYSINYDLFMLSLSLSIEYADPLNIYYSLSNLFIAIFTATIIHILLFAIYMYCINLSSLI